MCAVALVYVYARTKPIVFNKCDMEQYNVIWCVHAYARAKISTPLIIEFNSPVYGDHTEIENASGTTENIEADPQIAYDGTKRPIARHFV